MPIKTVSQSIYVYRADCLRVLDGDTIDAVIDLGFKVRWGTHIRFIGIDVFETKGQDASPLGKLAKAFLEKLFADHGPSFYFKSDRDEVAIYNRAAGQVFLETTTGGKKPKKVFIDVIETMKANGFDESKDPATQIAHDPLAPVKLVTRQAEDIMDLFV